MAKDTKQVLTREEIFKKVKELKLVYTEKPQPELLIQVPNDYPGKQEVEHIDPEFTSLCPFNPGQPDFGIVTFKFLPDQWLIELKSLKFYIESFRSVKIFHESIAPMIMQDLWPLMEPYYMQILVKNSVRGGIQTTSRSYQERPNWRTTNPFSIPGK